jgi:WD40 repeat protein
LILLGDFKKEKHVLRTAHEQHLLTHDKFRTESKIWKEGKVQSFHPQERKFSPQLNTDLKEQPNLIMGIEASDIKPERLRFYAQNQIAGIGDGGSVFIITFLDNRIFYTFQEHMNFICLLGRDILLLNGKGEVLILSFEKNEIIRLEGTGFPVCSLAAFPKDRAITGHKDGSICIWALTDKSLQKIKAHSGPVFSLATDHWGRIYSMGRDHFLKQWDLKQGTVSAAAFPDERILCISPYTGNKIMALSDHSTIHILDFKDGEQTSVFSPIAKPLTGCKANGDGRFFTIINETGKNKSARPISLPALFSPSRNGFSFQILNGHRQGTHDCLAMGPKLITCGKESSQEHSIRIWGTDHHVRTALTKLEILAG